MPDLSNLRLLGLPQFELACSPPSSPLFPAEQCVGGKWRRVLRLPASSRGPCAVLRKGRRGRGRRPAAVNSLEEHVQERAKKLMEAGVKETECVLPFLKNGLIGVQCWSCKKSVSEVDKVLCSVRDCRVAYHRTCVKLKKGSSMGFKCSQHICIICNRKKPLQCQRCLKAFHIKCSPWPSDVILLANQPGHAICWRHPADWHLDKQVG